MAGHSKWHNIQQRKGVVDAKRAKIFGQLSKLIRIAVKQGASGDPKFNPGLRVVLDKARAANMPMVNIERAIQRGLGKSSSGGSIQEIVYEGFGPGGVAVLAVGLTDNPNRTAGEVKFAFSRNGGSLGGPGSAMYMFKRDADGGYICTMPLVVTSEIAEQVLELANALHELDDIEDVYLATNIEEDSEKE